MTKFWILVGCCSIIYEVIALKDSEPEFEEKKFNQSMVENSVHFFLYHRSNFDTSDELVAGDDDLLNRSRYNADWPTTILIHGWTHSRDTPWMVEMREAMANKSVWNIIIVDWAPLARTLYTEARVHSPTVARLVGNLCLYLNKMRGLRMSDIHFVGHSMGAQISAMTSAYIRQHLSEKVGRITGLDPAAPLYEWPHMESSEEVIDPGDAIFVDVIHTNGNYLGMISPCGHVDYYPNGGMHQPGCTFWLCSHMRAVEFWTASIKNPFLFKAYPFSIWNQYVTGEIDGMHSFPMGIAANPKIPKGAYFLETVDEVQYIHTETTMMDSL
ncbi:pancreatic lipase-related protein 2-like [Coccinella septempunctata]|uniref:pancreatic lipase-related protein 2-like n=1 Tax=Coccinella septempunctata TaxID=41139 RepID=UPI001D08B99C|nr:pancreatic lipase-related protein 2-like [Coccinella septempunctata]